MRWQAFFIIAIIIAISGCVENNSETFKTTTTQETVTTSTSTTTTTVVSSTCTGFQYFTFQSQQYKEDGTYTIELLNGNQSVIILTMMVGSNVGPLTGNREPSASQSFAVIGTGYYYPGYKGDKFSFKVSISYRTPDIVTHSDSATCTGVIK